MKYRSPLRHSLPPWRLNQQTMSLAWSLSPYSWPVPPQLGIMPPKCLRTQTKRAALRVSWRYIFEIKEEDSSPSSAWRCKHGAHFAAYQGKLLLVSLILGTKCMWILQFYVREMAWCVDAPNSVWGNVTMFLLLLGRLTGSSKCPQCCSFGKAVLIIECRFVWLPRLSWELP